MKTKPWLVVVITLILLVCLSPAIAEIMEEEFDLDLGLSFDSEGATHTWDEGSGNHTITYEIIPSAKNVKITGYIGPGGSITIPGTINTYAVTEIGDLAFYESTITEVSIPNSVITIARGAFAQTDLTEVIIPAGVETIGLQAFWYNTSLSTVDFSNATNLETIGQRAFAETRSLHTVDFSTASLITIMDKAFYMCAIVTVDFSNATNLETIGVQAFYNNKLATVDFSNVTDLITIGAQSFAYQTDERLNKTLTKVVFPKAGTNLTIERSAFWNNGITSVIIPSSVKTIGDRAFYTNQISSVYFTNATNLITIGSKAFESNKISNIIFPPNLETIGESAFENNLLSLVDFQNVTDLKIGKRSFANNNTSAIIIIGFNNICGDNAFDDDSNLIYECVDGFRYKDTMGHEITDYVGNSTDIKIPISVKRIADRAFANDKLASITISSNVEYIGKNAFDLLKGTDSSTSPSVIFESRSTANELIIDYGAFMYSKIESIKIPANTISIGQYAFSNTSLLTNVTFVDGSNLTICEYAFFGSSISTIIGLETVKSIGAAAFNGNKLEDDKALIYSSGTDKSKIVSYGGTNREIIIPKDVTEISHRAFYFPASYFPASYFYINELEFEKGSQLKTIGYNAFSNNKLTTVSFENCNVLETIGDSAFEENLLRFIYISFSVVTIEEDAFYYNGIRSTSNFTLRTVVFEDLPHAPSELKTIGNGAFRLNILKELIIPSSVEYIGENAFQGLQGSETLEKIEIKNADNKDLSNLTTIGAWAFRFNNTKEIIIPETVTEIYQDAFISKSGTHLIIHNAKINITESRYHHPWGDNNTVTYVVVDAIEIIDGSTSTSVTESTVAAGGFIQFSVKTSPIVGGKVTWSMASSSATIDTNTGLFSAGSTPGTYVIFATSEVVNSLGQYASVQCEITVTGGSSVDPDPPKPTPGPDPPKPTPGPDLKPDYKIKYESNGGVGSVSNTEGDEGEVVTIKSNGNIVKTGYTFLEWNTSSNRTGNSYAAGDLITLISNITLYAQWMPISTGIQTFTITTIFNEHGEIIPGNHTVNLGENVTVKIVGDSKYRVSNVIVDGTSVGAVNVYVFNNVTKDHTIEAEFEEVSGAHSIIDNDNETVTEVSIKEDNHIKETVTKTTTFDEKITTVAKVEDSKLDIVSTATNTIAESKIETVLTTTTSVNNNQAKTVLTDAITDEMLKHALRSLNLAGIKSEDNTSKTVTVKTVSNSNNIKETELSISSESLAKISNNKASFKLESQTGTVLLDSNVVSNLSKQSEENNDTIRIVIGTESKENLNQAQQQKIGDTLIVSVKAYLGDKLVHDIGGTATISSGYNLNEGDKPEHVVVHYINDNGETTRHNTTYSTENSEVSFTTGHFSYFFVAIEIPTVFGDLPVELVIILLLLMLILIAHLIIANSIYTDSSKLAFRNTFTKSFVTLGFKPIDNLNTKSFRRQSFRPIVSLNTKLFRGLSFKPINNPIIKSFRTPTPTSSESTDLKVYTMYSNPSLYNPKPFEAYYNPILNNVKPFGIQYKEIKTKETKFNKNTKPFGNMEAKLFVSTPHKTINVGIKLFGLHYVPEYRNVVEESLYKNIRQFGNIESKPYDTTQNIIVSPNNIKTFEMQLKPIGNSIPKLFDEHKQKPFNNDSPKQFNKRS